MRKLIVILSLFMSSTVCAGTYTDNHPDYSSEAVLNKVMGQDEDFAIQDPWLKHAIDVIYAQYGDTVSIKDKSKDLVKFGRCETVSNSEPGSTIMTQIGSIDNETYLSTDGVTTISSGSTADTAITFTMEGHTVDGSGNFTFATQTGTLNGQNKVTLSTPVARVTRWYNTSAKNVTGPVYIYVDGAISSGVPTTEADVKMTIPSAKNQSEKASTTISNNDYWIVTSFYASVLEKTANTLADVRLEVRNKGGVFRQVADIGVEAGGSRQLEFKPYVIVPSNSDVRLVAVGSADNLDVSGGIVGVLAIVE